ncbi:hypothetical protein BGZ63DRAFT_425174 [Mariannaea sp. PMI_226]|nr:hypothetical protein BGZ63DRAFT_425174 [Mariannaea sp. PMI_226]
MKSTLFLASLLGLAAAAPSSSLNKPNGRTLVAVEKRDLTCLQNLSQVFLVQDAQALVSSLQNDDPDGTLPLAANGGWSNWSMNGFKICVFNDSRKDTAIKRWEAGWGLNVLLNSCCPSDHEACFTSSSLGSDFGLRDATGQIVLWANIQPHNDNECARDIN